MALPVLKLSYHCKPFPFLVAKSSANACETQNFAITERNETNAKKR